MHRLVWPAAVCVVSSRRLFPPQLQCLVHVQVRRSTAGSAQKKDLIGDVYIWGAPSGSVASGRSAHNSSSTEGLQESWVPTLVHDTFRLDVAAVCAPHLLPEC